MQFFNIETCHQTMISLDTTSGAFVHAPNGNTKSPAQLITTSLGIGILLGRTSVEVQSVGRLIPFRVRSEAQPMLYTLIDPATAMLLTAIPQTSSDVPGKLATNREKSGPWEMFKLQPAAPAPEFAGWSTLLELEELGSSKLGVAEILTELGRDKPRYCIELLRAYLVAHLPSSLEPLTEALMAHPTAAARLAGPLDPWLRFGLPDLSQWLEARDTAPARRSVAGDLDWLATLHMIPAQLGQVCSSIIRSKVIPRREACVVATVRNEGVYLLEWIAYHQAIGFEHFFIYSNNNDEGSDQLLAALSKNGVITWIDNEIARPILPQNKAYAHALGLLPDILDYAWALVVDVDEFFVFDTSRFTSVRDYLVWHDMRPSDAITLNWLMFGTFGALRFDSGHLMTRRFQTRFARVNPHIKTLCRPRLFTYSHAHYPRTFSARQAIFRNSVGNPYEHESEFALGRAPNDSTAWINHYWSKSIDELLCKFSRNRGDQAFVGARSPIQIAEDIASRMLRIERDASTVQDCRIAKCAKDLQSAIDGLLALPGVREAMSQVLGAFDAKIGMLRDQILSIGPSHMDAPGIQEVIRLVRDGEV